MRGLLLLMLAGCGSEAGDGGGLAACEGCPAPACEPVEGGAPCCDFDFDVTEDDCPDGTELQVECWTDSMGSGIEQGEDCVRKPGNVLATKACRPPGGGTPKGRLVSYAASGALAAYAVADEFVVNCHANGLMKLRKRVEPGQSVFIDGGCYEACYDESGAWQRPCPLASPDAPECEN